MAGNGKYRRVDIGFAAGAIISTRLQQDAYDKLQRSLSDDRSQRWHQLDAEDSTLTVDLSQVIYIRLDTESGRVGF